MSNGDDNTSQNPILAHISEEHLLLARLLCIAEAIAHDSGREPAAFF